MLVVYFQPGVALEKNLQGADVYILRNCRRWMYQIADRKKRDKSSLSDVPHIAGPPTKGHRGVMAPTFLQTNRAFFKNLLLWVQNFPLPPPPTFQPASESMYSKIFSAICAL